VRAHEKFQTAVVIFQDGFKVDVATARWEYYEYPAAMPTVELSSIKLDLYRRDFTINAMAIKLNPKEFGLLIDFFGGQRDLKEKTIRVLHSLSLVGLSICLHSSRGLSPQILPRPQTGLGLQAMKRRSSQTGLQQRKAQPGVYQWSRT
jgi:hypothetical protein